MWKPCGNLKNNRLFFQWILHRERATSFHMENVSSLSEDFTPPLKAGQNFNRALKVVQSKITFLDICMTVASIVLLLFLLSLGTF